jgi:hypothetical protein
MLIQKELRLDHISEGGEAVLMIKIFPIIGN